MRSAIESNFTIPAKTHHILVQRTTENRSRTQARPGVISSSVRQHHLPAFQDNFNTDIICRLGQLRSTQGSHRCALLFSPHREAQAIHRCQWRSRNIPCPILSSDDRAREARYRGVHIDTEGTRESRDCSRYIVHDFRSDREGSCVWTNTRRREQVYSYRRMANSGGMLTKRNPSIPVRQ